MKRYFPYILCTIVALVVAATAWSQQIVDGTGEVRNLTTDRASGRLNIDMDIDISSIEVGADETLILTPTIQKNGRELELPSVEIMGRRAWMYYRRNGEVPVTSDPLYADRIAKRAERKAGQKQSVDYTTSVPFEEWMRGSTVIVKEGSCGCDTTPIALGSSPVGRIMHEIYNPQYLLSFVEPEPEPVKMRAESHSAYINFRVDRYEILENYKSNADELASIINSIDRVKDDADLTITSVSIEGWASPEGTEQHNKTLSQNRANSLADYVTAKTGIARTDIHATGMGEDWAGLKREVDNTPRLLDQQKVLDIIADPAMTLDQKDDALEALIPPTIYQRLMNEMYPRLRRNDYRIEYSVRNFNIEEAKRMVDTDPSKLSVGEFYQVAGTYAKGSAEYNHVMEVAAKTYPTVVAAAVNQAAKLIGEQKYDEALSVLAKTDQQDARVLAAQGNAYMGKGDQAKAREAWEKAAAKGSADAKHNISELDKYLQSL